MANSSVIAIVIGVNQFEVILWLISKRSHFMFNFQYWKQLENNLSFFQFCLSFAISLKGTKYSLNHYWFLKEQNSFPSSSFQQMPSKQPVKCSSNLVFFSKNDEKRCIIREFVPTRIRNCYYCGNQNKRWCLGGSPIAIFLTSTVFQMETFLVKTGTGSSRAA